MELLGLLLSNLGGVPSISLTRKRRDGQPRSEPRELAVLLGKLVFASQVVWNGRAFMQAMLSSFAGCEIDWRHGKVSFRGGSFTKRMGLPGGFWDDLDWWGEHLVERYSVPWTDNSRRRKRSYAVHARAKQHARPAHARTTHASPTTCCNSS